jgi:uncharacterized protein YcbX
MNMKSELIVSELAIYPVKSLGQVRVETLAFDALGPVGDRRWMVVDQQGKFVTQRQLARMCLIQPTLTPAGVKLEAPGMTPLEVSAAGQPRLPVTVWNDQCEGIDAGEAAADWLSRFLGQALRLVQFPEHQLRQVDPAYARPGDRTAFSDGFPLLLISQASLDDLNRRLATPLSMRRFRPNLVIAGSEPHAEDSWRRLRIGDLTLRVVKPCSRCVIPSIDPDTAEKGVEPLHTLASYRRRDNKIYFGQNVIVDGQGEISTGMPVDVLE